MPQLVHFCVCLLFSREKLEILKEMIRYNDEAFSNSYMHSRVRHRGAVPPKMKKTKKPKFSLNGHEKPDLNSEFCHDSVKFAYRIAIYVLCSKIP